MAGKNVRKYLEARGLDAFYDLYHGLWETLYGKGTSLVGFIELIRELEQDNSSFLADTDACAARLKEAFLSLNHFFWPSSCDDLQEYKLREECQMKRWEPFDEAAWDSMFAQLASALKTSLQIWEVCYEKIKAVPLEQMRHPKSIAPVLTKSEEYFDHLSRMCNQEWVEFDVFNNWFLARLRQVGYIIDGAISGIEHILKSEPEPILDEGFRLDLDEITVAEVKFQIFVDPYRNPAIQFTDLPQSRKEAEWDAVWVEVAERLETTAKGLREHLTKLRQHSFAQSAAASAIHERFAEIENALDAFSQIILEMRYQAPLAVLSPKRT
jgi:hypothetical protein